MHKHVILGVSGKTVEGKDLRSEVQGIIRKMDQKLTRGRTRKI